MVAFFETGRFPIQIGIIHWHVIVPKGDASI